MTPIVRSEQQIALQTILQELEATVEQLEASDDVPDRREVRETLVAMADRRREFCAALQRQLRETDDLPKTPDPDRQLAVEVWRKFSAWLASKPAISEYLEHFIRADRRLLSTIRDNQEAAEASARDLLVELSGQLESDLEALDRLLEATDAKE